MTDSMDTQQPANRITVEQAVAGEQPQTSAGRRFARQVYNLTGAYVEQDILAIEAEARAEGRQQAVHLLKRIVDTVPAAHDVDGVILAAHEYLAGLNASESPRKPGCIYKHPHPDYECRNQDDMRDASESGQSSEASDE